MLEAAIDELGTSSEKTAYVFLPANKNEVIDAMDRNKIFGETFLRIEKCDKVPELNRYEFEKGPTLDELNFLAQRIEEISKDKTQLIAYRVLLQKPMNTVNEAINRTYDLQTVPVYPCNDLTEYGEIVLDNEFLEELQDVPDEVYELLDAEKVGRVMAEREGGVFMDGYYVVTDSYEPVLIYDEELPEQQEEWIFKLKVTGVPERPEGISEIKGEILTLPADEEHMHDLAMALGEKDIRDCIYFNFRSAIPQIKEGILDSMEEIYTLNDIARGYSKLSRQDAAKFKAVMERENCRSLNQAADILNSLHCYDFDCSIAEPSEFGIKYLSKKLPPDFDRTLLESINTTQFSFNVMMENDCSFTEYGVVSERGKHLYSMIETPRQDEAQYQELSL